MAEVRWGRGPLLERDAEIARLQAMLDAVAGGTGRLAVVEGDAGIGKSRLLAALRESAGDREFGVLSARGSELELDFPFGVVRQLFEPAIALAGERGRQALFDGAASLAEPVFSAAPARNGAPDPGFGVLHGLFWLVSNLADRGPQVLVVDDLHWSDVASLRFLAFLANRVEDVPVLVAAATRPVEPNGQGTAARAPLDEIRLHTLVATIEPANLSAEAVRIVLEDQLAEEAPTELTTTVHEATGGNAFFVSELARELATSGRNGDRPSIDRIKDLAPSRITASLVSRVSRLPAGSAELAQAIAVLGDAADPAMAARLAGIDPALADQLANGLVAAGVLLPGRPLRFQHPIIRSVIYEAAPTHERELAHARAAELLAELGGASDQIATQLLRSAPRGDPGTVATLRRAAGEASARGAPDAALDLLRRALAEPPPGDARPAVLFEAALAARAVGDPSGIEMLAEAFAQADDVELRTAIAAVLGEALSTAGRDEEAVDVLARAISLAEQAGLREAVARLRGVLLVLGNAVAKTRRIVRAELDAAVAAADDEDTPVDPVLLAHVAIERAIAIGPADSAVAVARAALEGGVLELTTADAPLVYLATGALWVSGRPREAERWLTAALDEASSRGSAIGYALASGFRSAARVRFGDLAGAQTDAEAALEFGLAGGWTSVAVPIAAATMIRSLLARGEVEAAAGFASQLGEAEIPDGLVLFQPLRLALADLELARERPEAALALLDAIASWEREWDGATGAWCSWRSRAAVAAHRLGDADRAVANAREEVDLARAFGAPDYLGEALRVAGELGVGPDDPIDQLREAVRALTSSDARLETARAQLSLGAALRRGGADRDAREPLRESQEIARNCGASAIERAALEELVATGARPRGSVAGEDHGLTPAELRVARLAAEGKTNREIAQGLFVTQKTVETHLGRVYRKLEINSRAQLPDRLEQSVSSPPG